MLLALAAAAPPCILSGCTAAGARADDGVPRAECPVCRKNGDLACLAVRIREDTPHAEHRGRTYWFCSEDCRGSFIASPERFAPP